MQEGYQYGDSKKQYLVFVNEVNMKNFRETVQRAIDKHWQTLRFLLSPLSKEALVNSLMNLYSLTYAKDLDKLLGSSSFKKILQDNKIKEIFINNIKTHKGNLWPVDRKSTRLNSSHSQISYA